MRTIRKYYCVRHVRRSVASLVCAATLLFIAGCKSPFPCSQRPAVSADVAARVGAEIGPGCGVQGGHLPPMVLLEDGLSEDDAVAAALWNNAAYNELLSQLGVSRAQLYDAGLITDPQLVVFFPVGPKQLEFTTFQAIDAIWLRPIRQRAAQLDLCELSQQMVQNGLDLARDVRITHANLLLAQERAELTTEAQRLREDIAALAAKRLDAGDISELEATSSRIEALQAEATAASAAQDVILAQENLRTFMGLPSLPQDLSAIGNGLQSSPIEDKEQLVAMAWAMRPDVRAIEIRKTAAVRRSELARKQFMNLEVGYDANAEGDKGFESGPGLRMTLPIFNGNKGGIAIADALIQQVDRQYATARDRVELEVRTAVTQLDQALEQRQLFDRRILPALTEAQELARRNYEDGGVPYFLVLQTTGQYVEAQLRRIDALANVRRAYAELERSVGRKLSQPEYAPFAVEVEHLPPVPSL